MHLCLRSQHSVNIGFKAPKKNDDLLQNLRTLISCTHNVDLWHERKRVTSSNLLHCLLALLFMLAIIVTLSTATVRATLSPSTEAVTILLDTPAQAYVSITSPCTKHSTAEVAQRTCSCGTCTECSHREAPGGAHEPVSSGGEDAPGETESRRRLVGRPWTSPLASQGQTFSGATMTWIAQTFDAARAECVRISHNEK